MRTTFRCGGLRLEGELELPASPRGAAIVCHPHPQFGGDMDHPLVRELARRLGDLEYATLRFNFRGTGGSEGDYGGGVEEVEDVRAAVTYLRQRSSVSTVTLAGYSFGALLILNAGAEAVEVDHLIAIAPPLAFAGIGFLGNCGKPKLFVVGDADQYCGLAQLEAAYRVLPDPKAMRVLPGVDHFFFGREREASDAVIELLGDMVA